MCPPDLLRVLAAAAVECVNALEIKHVGLHLRAQRQLENRCVCKFILARLEQLACCTLADVYLYRVCAADSIASGLGNVISEAV